MIDSRLGGIGNAVSQPSSSHQIRCHQGSVTVEPVFGTAGESKGRRKVTTRLIEIDPWVDQIQVRLVEDLPEACGGSVGYMDDRGVRWVLLDPRRPWRHPTFDLDLAVMWSTSFVEEWDFVTTRNLADRVGADLEEAQGTVWLCCVEWWRQRTS